MMNTILPWLLGGITILASIYTAFRVVTRYLICKGKMQADGENWKKLIEDRVSDTSNGFERFKKWAYQEHQDMNENVERKFAELQKDMTSIKESLSETNGYLKRLAEEKTS